MEQAAKELRNMRFGPGADALHLFAQPMPMKVPQSVTSEVPRPGP